MAVQLCINIPSFLQNPKSNGSAGSTGSNESNGFTSGEEGGHSTHLTKQRFKIFSRKFCTKFDQCDRALSWTNI